MKRQLAELTAREFDLAVIGGGIFGACAAWDAAQRGLSVALIERGDFCSGTSANSFKMVHGGIRYLQHGDLARLRQSSNERRALLRIAPHLVSPLPIVIPTYGRGMKSRTALRIGTGLYDLLTLDRNRGLAWPARRIPPARFLGRDQVLGMFPGLPSEGLTGAAVFCDGQMYNPPRLVLACIQSADREGAVVANYVEADALIHNRHRVAGLWAKDVLTGNKLEIRAKVVLNAAGPCAERLLKQALGLELTPPGTYSRDTCFIVPRPLLHPTHALAVLGRTSDPDALFSRGRRHLFIVPWRGCTLIGVWHGVHRGDPDDFSVTDAELEGYIGEIRYAYPGLDISLDDVSMPLAGLVPFGENDPAAVDLRYGHRSRLIDHAREHGLEGLITLIGVRFTTGRGEAAEAVNLAFRRLGRPAPPCRTAITPVAGGNMEDPQTFFRAAARDFPPGWPPQMVHALLRNYGTAYRNLLALTASCPALAGPLPGSHVLGAEVLHAIRQEMAIRLADVVFRRTELGTAGPPGEQALAQAAALMAAELGWKPARVSSEIDAVRTHYPLSRRPAAVSSAAAGFQPALVARSP